MSARLGSIAVAAVAALFMSATATLAQVNLRFGHDQPPGSMYDAGHVALKELVEELGLSSQKIYANEASNRRYIVKNGKLAPSPVRNASLTSGESTLTTANLQ